MKYKVFLEYYDRKGKLVGRGVEKFGLKSKDFNLEHMKSKIRGLYWNGGQESLSGMPAEFNGSIYFDVALGLESESGIVYPQFAFDKPIYRFGHLRIFYDHDWSNWAVANLSNNGSNLAPKTCELYDRLAIVSFKVFDSKKPFRSLEKFEGKYLVSDSVFEQLHEKQQGNFHVHYLFDYDGVETDYKIN